MPVGAAKIGQKSHRHEDCVWKDEIVKEAFLIKSTLKLKKYLEIREKNTIFAPNKACNKNMSQLLKSFLVLCATIISFASCNKHILDIPVLPDQDIVVMYENDVHCATEGYAKFAALRSEYEAQTPYVTTVSAGDFVQGGVMGTLTNGEGVTKIMNNVGYDIVTPGNHEFDYGMEQMYHLLNDCLDATVVCANFCHYPSMEVVFRPYTIKEYGKVKVAYIGLTTAKTLTSTSPSNFQDAGGNRIYDFMDDRLEEQTTRMVETARSEGATYVVLITHLGDGVVPGCKNALDIIHKTQGIDVVLDGHYHSVINDSLVANGEGKMVHYTSTGTKFQHMGVLTIGKTGNISTRLVKTATYDKTDAGVQAFVDEVNDEVSAIGDYVIGHTDFDLSVNDADGKRIVRNQESALANFVADSYMDLFDTDVALINGGGLRESLKAGDITYNNLLAVTPFSNTMCSATITGQQLLDGLEHSYYLLPNESGSFIHVGGMRLSIDISVQAEFVKEDGLFVAVAEGSPRRVSDLEIYNKATGQYEPVDPSRTYTVASSNFILRELGCSGAFRYAKPDVDLGITDVEATVMYLRDKLRGSIPSNYSSPEGRIVIH